MSPFLSLLCPFLAEGPVGLQEVCFKSLEPMNYFKIMTTSANTRASSESVTGRGPGGDSVSLLTLYLTPQVSHWSILPEFVSQDFGIWETWPCGSGVGVAVKNYPELSTIVCSMLFITAESGDSPHVH